MAKRSEPAYAKNYWTALQQGLLFEADMPEIWEFDSQHEANDWMKENYSFSTTVSLGFLRPKIKVDFHTAPSTIRGAESFIIPNMNKRRVLIALNYDRGKISTDDIAKIKFKHSDIYSHQLILIPEDGVVDSIKNMTSGGYHGVSRETEKRLLVVHELCEHAATQASPSFTLADNMKFNRAYSMSQTKNSDQNLVILEGAAAHMAHGYRHALVNTINAWVLEQFDEDGEKIVDAQTKGVLKMFAAAFEKYITPEDVQRNYGTYIGEMFAFLSSFQDYTTLRGILNNRSYRNDIRTAAYEHIRKAVWKLDQRGFQEIQTRAAKYLETAGFSIVTPGKG